MKKRSVKERRFGGESVGRSGQDPGVADDEERLTWRWELHFTERSVKERR